MLGVQEAASADASGWQVTLDGRGMKTVKGTPQIVPNEGLARALAGEWERQGETIDPTLFPMRDTADYALNIVAADPVAVASKLVDYSDTDTLLYRADPQDALYARQLEVWEPIVTRFEAREDVVFTRVSGIIHHPQSEAAITRLRNRLIGLDPFVLAGVEVITNLAASLITGLSASETDDQDEAAALWSAACLEEEWQFELWGRDEEEEERRAVRKADFLTAHTFIRLAQL